MPKCGQGSVLVRDNLELAWRVDELLADLVSKLDYSDKVAYTKTEAHRDSRTALLLVYQKRIRESGMRKAENRKRLPFGFADRFVCTQPHEAGFHPLGRLRLDALATSGLHRRLRLAIWAS